MKRVLNLAKSLAALVLISFLVNVFFFYKSPPRVYMTQKAGVNVLDSIASNGNEVYTFTNNSTVPKTVFGFHLEPMVIREPEPLFKLVVQPGEKKSVDAPGSSGMTTQLRISEFNCEKGEITSTAYINAVRLGNGYKD